MKHAVIWSSDDGRNNLLVIIFHFKSMNLEILIAPREMFIIVLKIILIGTNN